MDTACSPFFTFFVTAQVFCTSHSPIDLAPQRNDGGSAMIGHKLLHPWIIP